MCAKLVGTHRLPGFGRQPQARLYRLRCCAQSAGTTFCARMSSSPICRTARRASVTRRRRSFMRLRSALCFAGEDARIHRWRWARGESVEAEGSMILLGRLGRGGHSACPVRRRASRTRPASNRMRLRCFTLVIPTGRETLLLRAPTARRSAGCLLPNPAAASSSPATISA